MKVIVKGNPQEIAALEQALKDGNAQEKEILLDGKPIVNSDSKKANPSIIIRTSFNWFKKDEFVENALNLIDDVKNRRPDVVVHIEAG